MTEELMNRIKQEVQQAETQPQGQRFLACTACFKVQLHDMATSLPRVCAGCGVADPIWGVGLNPGQAKEQAAAKANSPKPPVVGNLTPPTQPVAPAVPQPPVQPQPAPAAPKPRRAAKAKPVAEEQPEAAAEAAPKPHEAPVEPVMTQTADGPDFKAQRMEAVRRLIAKFNLTPNDFRPCGEATVYTKGFTIWANKTPSYTFLEDTDTAESFRAMLEKARAKHGGTVTVDVALMTDISDDILPCLFNSQLIAKVYGPRGPVPCKAGQRVSIGARVSNSGSLVWMVLGVVE